MNIAVLAAEIGAGGKANETYAGMTAAQVADALNTPRKVGTRLRELTTREVLDALGKVGGAKEAAKVEGASDEAISLAAYLYGAGGVDMAEGSFGRALLTTVVSAEGLAACVSAATEDVMLSRREEIGLTEPVGDGHVRSIAGWEGAKHVNDG